MLDNVNSGDFEEGANPAVTEVEKQVQEALAAHDTAQVAKTLTDDPAAGTSAGDPMMTSGSDVPTAVPAPASDDPDPEPAAVVDEAPLPEPQPAEPVAEPIATEEIDDAEIPKPLTGTGPEEPKTDLASTVPGIKVEEPPVQGLDLGGDEASSGPIAPPPVPEGVVVDEPEPVVAEQPQEPSEPEQAVEEVTDVSEPSQPDAIAQPEDPATIPDEPAQADQSSVVDLETPETSVVSDEVEPVVPSVEAFTVEDPPAEQPEEPQETPMQPEEPVAEKVAPIVASAPIVSTVPAVDTDKLAGLKKHALDHLEPLADKLEQSPVDEFKTTMMRIQANDNHTLLDKALTVAKSIPDDNARAQALLDIVNEINYFSANLGQE